MSNARLLVSQGYDPADSQANAFSALRIIRRFMADAALVKMGSLQTFAADESNVCLGSEQSCTACFTNDCNADKSAARCRAPLRDWINVNSADIAAVLCGMA